MLLSLSKNSVTHEQKNVRDENLEALQAPSEYRDTKFFLTSVVSWSLFHDFYNCNNHQHQLKSYGSLSPRNFSWMTKLQTMEDTIHIVQRQFVYA